MSGRLDDEKLETLRSWGAGLAGDARDELRAAGKAILILVEEIERLQVDVWHAHDGSTEAGHLAAALAPAQAIGETRSDQAGAPGESAPLESTLRRRIRRLVGPREPRSP